MDRYWNYKDFGEEHAAKWTV